VNAKNTKKLTAEHHKAGDGSDQTFPEVKNALRARLSPVFKLPAPLNDWMFRLTVYRFFPWMKTAKLTPLRLVNEESVTGSRGQSSALTQRQRVMLAAQAAIETGLTFHLPPGKKLTLQRLDGVFEELEANGDFIARAEFEPEEIRLLHAHPEGKILKGAAVVNAQNELIAKAVAEFTWRTVKRSP
jgi:hypothetical protein